MSISFSRKTKTFTLKSANTSYLFQLYGEYPVHLYYGATKRGLKVQYMNPYRSFSPYYEKYGGHYSPDIAMGECPFFGSGDFRTTALKIRNGNGDCVTLFKYKSYKIFKGRVHLEGLPYGEADENTETLCINMTDDVTGCILKLYYTVFGECDVISRYFTVTNNGKCDVKIEKAMSLTLDIYKRGDLDWLSLNGSYGEERYLQRKPLLYGMQSISSRRGSSSQIHNPFIAVCDKKATEAKGDAFGFNFVWSGGYIDEIEVDQNMMTRVQVGLGEENFGWLLKPGESFTTPEAVMTYSPNGIGGMSRNFHAFVNNHISPAEKYPQRPVVLNTWEASFFDIDEDKVVEFAKAAPEANIDMLVMDDGWFGKRNNDCAGLGDWYENRDKFKDGLKPFVKRVKDCGVKFGIWIEPEMVNPDSDLYRAHPEWCLQCKGRELMLSRNQYVLDMSNHEVIEYLEKSFAKTFDGVGIDYIKWDMNRHLSVVGSPAICAERQDEVPYRYVLGVYELLRWFGEKFPDMMIETCSGGGARYDLGIMKYCSQIWTSDNTWPGVRISIQYGTSIAYPASVMSCHVSNADNMTADMRKLNFGFRVAIGGMLGYELHLPNASKQVRDVIAEQVTEYRGYEELIKKGELYRILSPFETPYSCYCFTDMGAERILFTFLQICDGKACDMHIKLPFADADATYEDEKSGTVYSGSDLRKKGITVTTDGKGYFVKMHCLKKL